MEINLKFEDVIKDESLRAEIVETVSGLIYNDISRKTQEMVDKAIRDNVNIAVTSILSNLINLHLDTEFSITNDYGKKDKVDTLRNRIAWIIEKQTKIINTTYESEKSVLSKLVESTVKSELEKFKTEFNGIVNKQLIESCLDEATKRLKAAIGLK